MNLLMQKKISLENLNRLFLILRNSFFFVLSFIVFTLQSARAHLLWCGLVVSFLSLYFYKRGKWEFELNFNSFYMILLSFSALIALPVAIYHKTQNLFHFIIILSTLTLSYIFIRDEKSLYWSLKLALIFIQWSLIIYIRSYSGSDPLGNLVEGVSYNGISSYIVVLQCSYCVVSFLYKRSIPWFTSIVTMYICYIGFGRGSIIAGALVAFLNFVYLFNKLTPRQKFFMMCLCLTLVMGVYLEFGSKIFLLYRKTKFAAGFYFGQRPWMWSDYLTGSSFLDLLFGRDFGGLVVGEFFNGNPHNTFIRSHSKFGLFYVLMIMASPLLSFYSDERLSTKLYLFGMFGIVFLRAMTETILFPAVIDIYFFSALLYMFIRNPKLSLRGKYVE